MTSLERHRFESGSIATLSMPTEPFLLTIAIPTYNRSRFLVRLLDTLASQLEREPRVELLISDNASPDDTPIVLEQFRSRGLVFRGIRNSENIGGDGNIHQCFVEASGIYVWILGDDDVVLPGTIRFLVDLIAGDEYDLVHFRAKPLLENAPIPDPPPARPKLEIIRDAPTFALRTHVYLTFISGNIINKHRAESLPHPPFSDLVGTYLEQLSWTYTVLRSFRKGVYVHDPLFAAGSDDRGGYALFTVFGSNLKRITEIWLVDPVLTRIILNGTIQTFFPVFVLRCRMQMGSFTAQRPDRLLHSLFAGNYRYHLFLVPLLRLPAKLGRLWLLLCRIVNRIDKLMGNPMLR